MLEEGYPSLFSLYVRINLNINFGNKQLMWSIPKFGNGNTKYICTCQMKSKTYEMPGFIECNAEMSKLYKRNSFRTNSN